MILKNVSGLAPKIAHSARVAETAALIGDVELGAFTTVWYGAVLRGDCGPIRVGDGSNIQDNCVLHCGGGPTILGRNVTVGHGAILHSCTLKDGCLVGMGSTVLDGAVIGEGSIVAAGALVPPGMVVPPRCLVMGVPAKVARAVSEQEAGASLVNVEHYVELGRAQLEAPEED